MSGVVGDRRAGKYHRGSTSNSKSKQKSEEDVDDDGNDDDNSRRARVFATGNYFLKIYI